MLDIALGCASGSRAHRNFSLRDLLCHQVTDKWRSRCTKWQKENPTTILPEVIQATRGRRRKVLRVLPFERGLAVARQLIADGFKEIEEEIQSLTANLKLTESDQSSDADNVGEE